ncbi:MAG: Holliday junction resolvase-like protein [Xanthobacteraceae bacterium]
MTRSSRELISELQRNKGFMGTCPTCLEEFRLADATLFSISEAPPETALAAIQAIREAIRERKDELSRAKARMTERAQTTAQAVNLGKIVEKIVPSFASFEYAPGDCRALFEPIDYLIFSGLSARRRVDSIHFVDVKSGAARLAAKQRSIKEVVESGAVKFKLTQPRD